MKKVEICKIELKDSRTLTAAISVAKVGKAPDVAQTCKHKQKKMMFRVLTKTQNKNKNKNQIP